MTQKENTIKDIRITTEFLKTIQFNSYSLYSENMLCAMPTDLRAEVRVKAVVIILTCRDTPVVWCWKMYPYLLSTNILLILNQLKDMYD